MDDKIRKEQFERLSEAMIQMQAMLEGVKQTQENIRENVVLAEFSVEVVEGVTKKMKEYFDAWVKYYEHSNTVTLPGAATTQITKEEKDGVEKLIAEMETQIQDKDGNDA